MPEKPDKTEIEQLLSSYLDGTCSQAQRQRVQAALREDPRLRALHEQLRRTIEALRTFPSEPAPEHARRRILSKLERQALLGASASGSPEAAASGRRTVWLGLLAAAMLMAGVGATWWYHRQREGPFDLAAAPAESPWVEAFHHGATAPAEHHKGPERAVAEHPPLPLAMRDESSLDRARESALTRQGEMPMGSAPLARTAGPAAAAQSAGPSAMARPAAGQESPADGATLSATAKAPQDERKDAISRDARGGPETTAAIPQLRVTLRDFVAQATLAGEAIQSQVTAGEGMAVWRPDISTILAAVPAARRGEVIRSISRDSIMAGAESNALPSDDPLARQAMSLAAQRWFQSLWPPLSREESQTTAARPEDLTGFLTERPRSTVYAPLVIVLQPQEGSTASPPAGP